MIFFYLLSTIIILIFASSWFFHSCLLTKILYYTFFLVGKSNVLIKKEGPQAAKEYTENILRRSEVENKRRTKREDKENPPAHTYTRLSHLDPSQVKKYVLSTLYMQTQDHKLLKKLTFILFAQKASFSKVTLFLSSHSAQNKQRGSQPEFFMFLANRGAPCQERRACRTVNGKTQ